ncbi:putative sulfite oxidase subunit YedY [Vibrio sp. JCM 19052]|nr:putative sulfite oxidase subunit YedY [Vibrio sp. JCM 19052]
MWIKKNHRWALSENEATPESVYKERREILKKLGIAVVGMPLAANSQAGILDIFSSRKSQSQIIELTLAQQSQNSTKRIFLLLLKVRF